VDLLKLSSAMGFTTALVEVLIPSPPLTLPYPKFPLGSWMVLNEHLICIAGLDDNLVLPVVGAFTYEVMKRELDISEPAFSKLVIF